MFNQIDTSNVDLEALALFMLEEVDCDPAYEDDQFVIHHEGHPFYIERRKDHFMIECFNSGNSVDLPRI